MKAPFYSEIIGNAIVDGDELAKHYNMPDGYEKKLVRVVVLRVTMGEKQFFCCLAGGRVKNAQHAGRIVPTTIYNIELTPIGEITTAAAVGFARIDANIIFAFMDCRANESDRLRKIVSVFQDVQPGDLVVFRAIWLERVTAK